MRDWISRSNCNHIYIQIPFEIQGRQEKQLSRWRDSIRKDVMNFAICLLLDDRIDVLTSFFSTEMKVKRMNYCSIKSLQSHVVMIVDGKVSLDINICQERDINR